MHKADMVKLIREIQAVDFAIYELALFLNTHPNDRKALEDHNNLVTRSRQLKAQYEDRFGPLRLDSLSKFPWQYINDPWPWEIVY